MAKVNFLRIKGTPWGSVVSSIIRSWAASNQEAANELSFDDLDVEIRLNGTPLEDATLETFIKTLNGAANVSSAAGFRDRIVDLLDEVSESMTNRSMLDGYNRAINDMHAKLESCNIAFLVENMCADEAVDSYSHNEALARVDNERRQIRGT